MDEESWFSVTPEEITARQARWCVGAGVVIDAFAGVGGNAIQFAQMCQRVVAIDIDPKKVAMAYNNGKIYGLEDFIDFIVRDFFQLAPFLTVLKISKF
ncbi:trimethylguanosine synthase-like [Olea europaea var. sylvestris]|uniref:trimethylguanosine synthase-like n=1 Tax=Olea europaea var. sylvestris TaxID=158386 RepID=UPI000C1D3A2B|nr:trimethylguanosine synthase-like [Olea europaea var. sylvestris]